MSEQGQTIRVDIFDRAYHLRSAADESYTRHLAQTVDTAMHAIAEQTQTVESLRIAVLAALHFADRYEQLRQRYERLNGMVAEKSAQIQEALEAAGEMNSLG